MNTDQIVALLIQERDRLNHAIEVLQGVKRTGRPVKNASAVEPVNGAKVRAVKKRSWSAAQRKAASERMRSRWAKKRAAKK